jgi:hypothetical protein
MGKSKIPDPLDRRHLIEKKLGGAQALEIAEAYLAAGRTVEAVDFLAKADARDRLADLRSGAVAAGDVFLLRMIALVTEEPPARAEWSAVAAAAEAAGMDRYAVEAKRQLDREDDE